jgi:tripartite-type tricarboxylate transporter receptor subunit TctC
MGETMLHSVRRATLVLGLVLGISAAAAQDYPSQAIRFVQGFPAGGNADAVVRILADEMSKSFGQPVLADARPGAGGNLAAHFVARAAPDGYTLLLITTAHVISPALYKSLNYDSFNDFTFISTVTDLPFLIVANAESPYKSLQDVVAAAKAKPGTLTVGTAGVGTGQHMCTELFMSSTATKLIHVPFKGDAGAVAALLSKNVDVIVAPGTAVLGNIQGGRFRALGISGSERWPPLKDVPTVAETVSPGFEMIAWIGVAAPKDLPRPIVDRLNAELRRVIALPKVDERLRALGGFPRSSTPEFVTKRVQSEIARWKEVAEKANMPKR